MPEAVLGLFIHTPFPSSEVFRCLPSKSIYFVVIAGFDVRSLLGRKEILDGILGANLVCFQVNNILVLLSARC